MSAGALDGLLVIDFTRVLAGPYATMMLADMGARVIKIERPITGDDTRSWGPPYDPSGTTTYFNSVNRNKTSTVLDLSTAQGRAEAVRLASTADIVIENFRAGTMGRLGLDYERLSATNPGLIYCSITGFGSGRGASLPGYDLLVQALGGLMSITGSQRGAPTKVGVAVVDVLTGTHALSGILAALHHRDRTGNGQYLETDLLSVLLSSLVNQAAAYQGAGVVPGIMGNRHPSIAPYEEFATKDRPLVVAVGNDRQFRDFVTVLGVGHLAEDPRFVTNADRVEHRDALRDEVLPLLAARGAEAWFRDLTAAGVPAGPINDIAEAFTFAESLGLPVAVRVPGSDVPYVGNPLRFSQTPVAYYSGPPALGSPPVNGTSGKE
ncbi:CaiB/BaiF CoA transferase family protein [Nocardia callitridis]|uniref:CoA transferase n=1 Tax=Nocardia callitridis TaxID=648753 RepID=A0ABP9K7J3_9NOCA